MSAGTRPQVSLYEYLHSVYEPDCDYVDGELEERNWGEWNARLQALLGAYPARLQEQRGLIVLLALRLQVNTNRFRVPDLCAIFRSAWREQILTTPPFLCIEILSPDDVRMQRKIADYLDMGVRYVWVISPETRTACSYTSERMVEAKDGVLRTADPEIAVPLAEIFAKL